MGSVAPAVSLPVAVKLAEAFPIEFLQLTNEISDLTGRGADLVKPQAARNRRQSEGFHATAGNARRLPIPAQARCDPAGLFDG